MCSDDDSFALDTLVTANQIFFMKLLSNLSAINTKQEEFRVSDVKEIKRDSVGSLSAGADEHEVYRICRDG
ncbi:predicted protein [Botrytis cinerea T4]|uniref:Uncharacterized protein n=1 Tax=Botryotinia fuckeliana (strain T4) TaxID=999810 RepID=G2YE76_BOTF4|nr:predicted protein [Botrytis cinerea T4]